MPGRRKASSPNVATCVAKARAHGTPVLWVQHHDDELVQGTPRWQWVPQLVPAAGEPLLHKRFNSSFEETVLDDLLADRHASRIVLAGAATNWCIRATAYGALDRGYDLILVRDALTTGDIDLGDGAKVEAETMIQDLNIAMTWLSYPGRTTRTTTAAALDFAASAEPR